MREYSFVVLEFRCREMLYFTVDGVISGGRMNSPQQKGNNDISLPFCPSRDQEWQPKEHPGSLLHPVTLQAATAATAATQRLAAASRHKRCSPGILYYSFISDVFCWFGSYLEQTKSRKQMYTTFFDLLDQLYFRIHVVELEWFY